MDDFARRAEPPRAGPIEGGIDRRVRIVPARARFSLRLADAAIGAAGAALGLALDQPINRAVREEGRAALRLGPDEWLVLAEANDDAIPGVLERALPAGSLSLVDIGHRQIGIGLDTADAAAMLNAGCPLDLAIGAFPVGMATRTVFAKAEIVLWRTGNAAFHLEVWRSFAPYVVAMLAEIGREYPA